MNRALICPVSLLALLSLSACGDPDGGRPMNTSDPGLTSLTTSSSSMGDDETGNEQDTDDQGESASTDDSGDGSPVPKFDLGTIPDGEAACTDDAFDQDFSYIWIANSTQGTVSKINTETAVEEGRYRTTQDASMQPSRTSVNQFGDVAVGHRHSPKVTKIAPTLDRCVDRNNNGMIETSSGPNDVLPFMEDECVLWSVDLPYNGAGTRAVAWEGGVLDAETCTNTKPNPRLWVAYAGNPLMAYRLDGETGATLDTVPVNSGGYVYGGAVNAEGDLWISDRSAKTLSHIDADTLTVSVHAAPGSNAYGIGVDEAGDPWIATYASGGGDHVYRFDTANFSWVDAGGGMGRYRGMNIDREGRAWVAGNSPCRLAQFDALNDSVVDDNIPLPGCSDPVGVSVDRDGFVWVVDRGANRAWKVDPVFKTIVATVEGLVSPYTYSDMTGQGLNLVVNPPG